MQRHINIAMLFAAIWLTGCSPSFYIKNYKKLEERVVVLETELMAQRVQHDAFITQLDKEGRIYPQLSDEPSLIIRPINIEGKTHEIEIGTGQYFKSRLLTHSPIDISDYARFVDWYSPVLCDIVNQISPGSPEKRAQALLDVVGMSRTYHYDIEQPYTFDFVRHPIETLVEYGVDCEDSAILYASLLKSDDIDCVLIFAGKEVTGDEDGHMLVGVSGNFALQDTPVYFVEYNSKRYTFAETVSAGRLVGDIDGKYSGKEVTLIPLLESGKAAKQTYKAQVISSPLQPAKSEY